MYSKLQAFYSKHFGDYKEEYLQEEPGYAVEQSNWMAENGKAYVVNNITGVGVRITWSTSY